MTIRQMASVNSAYRSMYVNQAQAMKGLKRLSSGYKINSAGDDAAGLAISEKMRGQIRGLSKAYENTQQGISMLQTADGYLGSTYDVLSRMRELAVQSTNGTYSDSDRALLDNEFQSLLSEIDRIASNTSYNGIALLDGTLGGTSGAAGLAEMGITSVTAGAGNTYVGDASFAFQQNGSSWDITAEIDGETLTATVNTGDTNAIFTTSSGDQVTLNFGSTGNLREGEIKSVSLDGNNAVDTSGAISYHADNKMVLQVGANGTEDQRISFRIGDVSASALGLKGLNISSLTNATDALGAIDSAINQVLREQSNVGALTNRLEYTVSNLGTSIENMTSAESTIRDADIAKEMMLFTQRSIQMMASQAMYAQSMNLTRQNILGLLMR